MILAGEPVKFLAAPAPAPRGQKYAAPAPAPQPCTGYDRLTVKCTLVRCHRLIGF